jgi:hypothetical protein
LMNLHVDDKMRELSDWSKQHPIDVKAASDSWVNFADTVTESMDKSKNAVEGFTGMAGGAAGFGGILGAPGLPLPGTVPGTAGAATTSGTASDTNDGRHHADWDAIAKQEGDGQWNITYTTGVPEGGGLQIKPDTWQMYGGTEFADKPYKATKEQQEAVGERILNGWNGIPGQGPDAWDHGKTYVEKKAKGGAPGRSINQGSGNGDDVAALLGRGEYVWDTETVNKYGWFIKALHQGEVVGYDQGGGTSPNGGILGAPEDTISVNGVSAQAASGGADQILQTFAQWFNDNIEPVKELAGYDRGGHGMGDKSNHASGTALDINWSDFTALQGHGADATTHFTPDQMKAIATELASLQMTWGQYWTPDSRDPGHFELNGAAYAQHPANPVIGATPGGKNGYAYPGMAGQYGGGGVYGGETADQAYSAAHAVQEAQDRAADLDHDIAEKQKRIKDIQDELNKPDDQKVGMLGVPIAQTPAEAAAAAQKKKTLNDELDAATYDLTKSQRERSEQDGAITEAQRKQQEAGYKKPSGTSQQSAEGKAGETLGQGLLGGIGQELGLGDVLGKSPMDWGIVKLAEGLLNYGNNLGDAIFGKSGGLGGPGGSGGMASGMATGMLGSLGIKLPNAAISASSNVIPVPMGSPASGQGSGTPPGPPVAIDQSINISPNVDPSAVLGPVIGLQRDQAGSNNANSFTQTGGFPAQ